MLATRQVARFTAHIGRLKVTEHLLSYEKRRLPGQELLGQVSLGSCRPRSSRPWGCGWKSRNAVKHAIYGAGLHFIGGIHPWSTS